MVLENFSGEIKASEAIGGGEWKKSTEEQDSSILQVNLLV